MDSIPPNPGSRLGFLCATTSVKHPKRRPNPSVCHQIFFLQFEEKANRQKERQYVSTKVTNILLSSLCYKLYQRLLSTKDPFKSLLLGLKDFFLSPLKPEAFPSHSSKNYGVNFFSFPSNAVWVNLFGIKPSYVLLLAYAVLETLCVRTYWPHS